MALTFEKLRYFIVLAEELNFTRAAERVFMTQQAFSTHIRQLEAWLGTPLFERTTRDVKLTNVGRQLIEPVRDAMTQLDAAFAEVRALGGVRKLRIGVTSGGAGELMAAILEAFRRTHPDVTVEMLESAYERPSCDLRDGLVDVALVRPPVNIEGIVLQELFHEPIVLAVSTRHPLANATEVTLEEALAQPLVLARNTNPEWDNFWLLCEQRGGRPQVAATAGSLMEEIETVAAGSASSFFPASTARVFAHHPGVSFLPIIDGPVSKVALAWREKALPTLARAFIEIVDQVVATEVDLVAALEAGRQPD